jgi:hypothetical protein
MIDMQLLNSALMALAVLVGAAITLSAAIVAVAGITGRRRARYGGSGGSGGSGGTGIGLSPRPARDVEDARVLVSH